MLSKSVRPLLIRLAPLFLRQSIAIRFFRNRPDLFHLYRDASLFLKPNVRMNLIPGDIISDMIALTGMYEHKKAKRMAKLAEYGGVLVDVGANLGFFSLLWASQNFRCKVFSFEASPRNIELLKQNIDCNAMGGQVTIYPVAVGHRPGKLDFEIGNITQTGWGGFTQNKTDKSIRVEVVTLDNALAEIPQIDLLKIDIEGADFWAIQGCENLLRQGRVKEIWFEQNKPRARALGIPENASQDFLRSLGYFVFPESDPKKEMCDWIAVVEKK